MTSGPLFVLAWVLYRYRPDSPFPNPQPTTDATTPLTAHTPPSSRNRSNEPSARVFAAFVPLLNLTRLFSVGSGIIEDNGLVLSVSRSGDKSELLKVRRLSSNRNSNSPALSKADGCSSSFLSSLSLSQSRPRTTLAPPFPPRARCTTAWC